MHRAGLVSTLAASAVVRHWKAVYWETRMHRLGRGGRKRTGLRHLGGRLLYFVITGRSREQLETEVKPLVERFMRERGLELSPEKTVVTHIANGFDFLAQNVRKYNGKMLIKPASKSIRSFLRKVRGIIRTSKGVAAGILIARLNPLIKGWAMYHRHVVSAEVFKAVDNAIWHSLWRWAKWRHPHKGARWVKDKYFHHVGDRNGVFSGERTDGKGAIQTVHLMRAASVSIKRHTKIQNRVNPYDPAWEAYIEERMGLKMAATLVGRRTLLYLWKRQGGTCPQCGQPITTTTGWHIHHKVWRSKGGSNAISNRVLLHPTCHSQVHHRQESPVAARPGDRAFAKA